VAGPNVLTAQVNVAAAGQLGQAPPGEACPNVPAAQINVIVDGQLGQSSLGAAGPNVATAGQLGQAPPGVAAPNVPAAQVKVRAAGQLRQAPPGHVHAAGPDVPVQPGNDAAHPHMVRDSSSPDNVPVPAQMLPDPRYNGPRKSKTNMLPEAFVQYPTIGLQVSHT